MQEDHKDVATGHAADPVRDLRRTRLVSVQPWNDEHLLVRVLTSPSVAQGFPTTTNPAGGHLAQMQCKSTSRVEHYGLTCVLPCQRETSLWLRVMFHARTQFAKAMNANSMQI
jgi:hypothetical protein